MAKFKFSLKSVEKYRNVLLDEAKARYAKAVDDSNTQINRIKDLEKRLAQQEEELRIKNAEGMSILEIQGYRTYMNILDKSIKDEQYKLKTLKKIEQKRRWEMILAKTDAMSIEKIKEKRLEEHKKEEAKKEDLATQEFVSNRLSRQD